MRPLKRWASTTFFSALALLLILVCVGPVFFLFWNASKSAEEYYRSKFLPPGSLAGFIENVGTLMEVGFFHHLQNTLLVAALTVGMLAVFSSMSGFAFAKLRLPGKKLIYWAVISLLAMPTQVFLIPVFVMFSNLNMTNNLFTLALVYTGFNYAFGTFLMCSFYKGIPDEILDSARIDGARKLQIYLRIMIPLGKPAITTLAVLTFFEAWNELLVSLIFNNTRLTRLITPGIAMFQQIARGGRNLTNWPLIYSGMILSLVLPFMVYFLFQRKIASGLTVGALKG